MKEAKMKEIDLELLKRIAEYEDSLDPKSFKGMAGWRPQDVGIWPANVSRLRMEGLVEDGYESNSYHGYKLSPKARALLAGEPEFVEVVQNQKFSLPDDLFEDIIGHDEVKELLRASLMAEKPVHVLLAGPPALAKTLFLWDIERAAGEKAVWLVGSATSKAGLWDLVAERQPKVLLIDELDKMNAADTAALLSMMEGGRLVRAKVGRQLSLEHQIWVGAATNRLDVLSPELRSRFAIRRLNPYSRSDYLSVVRGVLVRREGASSDVAEEIAARLDGQSQDVRDAIRVVRLAPQLGVEKAVRLLLGR
jgi:Holliday junction DNA helicase RuvB